MNWLRKKLEDWFGFNLKFKFEVNRHRYSSLTQALMKQVELDEKHKDRQAQIITNKREEAASLRELLNFENRATPEAG